MELERDAADRTAIGAVGGDEVLSIAREQREDALDRIAHALPRWLEKHRTDATLVRVEDSEQHILFAGEEMVETPGVDVGGLQNVGDARRAVSCLGKQAQRRVHDPLSGVRSHWPTC